MGYRVWLCENRFFVIIFLKSENDLYIREDIIRIE